MYIEKIFSCVDSVDGNAQEKLYSVIMDSEEYYLYQLFSEKSNYGDIDEEAPDDPYYHKGFEKWGKRIAKGGAAVAGLGTAGVIGANMAGAQKGYKAMEDIAEHQKGISSAEFFSKDHFGHSGTGDWFDQNLKDTRERMGKKIQNHKDEIKKITSKNKKAIKAAAAHTHASGLVGLGTGAAVLGGALWAGSKLGQNSRKSYKKDAKDILDQSRLGRR